MTQKHERGFAPIIVLILAGIVLLGGGMIFYKSLHRNIPVDAELPTTCNTNADCPKGNICASQVPSAMRPACTTFLHIGCPDYIKPVSVCVPNLSPPTPSPIADQPVYSCQKNDDCELASKNYTVKSSIDCCVKSNAGLPEVTAFNHDWYKQYRSTHNLDLLCTADCQLAPNAQYYSAQCVNNVCQKVYSR